MLVVLPMDVVLGFSYPPITVVFHRDMEVLIVLTNSMMDSWSFLNAFFSNLSLSPKLRIYNSLEVTWN